MLCALCRAKAARVTSCTLMIDWLYVNDLFKPVLHRVKFSMLLKSRRDHSIGFKNISVKRTTAIKLNESFPVARYQPTLEYLRIFTN